MGRRCSTGSIPLEIKNFPSPNSSRHGHTSMAGTARTSTEVHQLAAREEKKAAQKENIRPHRTLTGRNVAAKSAIIQENGMIARKSAGHVTTKRTAMEVMSQSHLWWIQILNPSWWIQMVNPLS